MIRFVVSLAVGLLLGLGVGLYLGWVQFPKEYINSPARDLAQEYKNEYTVMIATGWQADRDLPGAVERLRVLGVENIPQYVQGVTERYITTSRDVRDIRVLVAFSEALDRLTPIMEPYRQLNITGSSS